MSYTTLWEVPDGLWEKVERLLPPEKPAGTLGRPALPNRPVVNGILFVLRSGCQWKGLKKEWYGTSSSLHQRFQTWNEAGLWKKIYRVMVKYYHKKRHIQWRWQALDSKLVPAPSLVHKSRSRRNPSIGNERLGNPITEWHRRIPDPTIADAILDRLIHNAHCIELKGESQRKLRAKRSMANT